MKVFADTFNPEKENTPVRLFPWKRLGFCRGVLVINDYGYDRESFMGSVLYPRKG